MQRLVHQTSVTNTRLSLSVEINVHWKPNLESDVIDNDDDGDDNDEDDSDDVRDENDIDVDNDSDVDGSEAATAMETISTQKNRAHCPSFQSFAPFEGFLERMSLHFFLRFHLHSHWIEELLFLVKMSGPSGARQTGSNDVIIPRCELAVVVLVTWESADLEWLQPLVGFWKYAELKQSSFSVPGTCRVSSCLKSRLQTHN